MPTRLSNRQTRTALRRFGVERIVAPVFGLVDGAHGVRYDTHRHSRHQFLLPAAGVLVVETRQSILVCDAATGAWIPAGTAHATTLGRHDAWSVFFSPILFSSSSAARTFPVAPLLREMIAGQNAGLPEAVRADFSRVIFALIEQALAAPPTMTLARPKSGPLLKAVEYLLTHLDDATVRALAAFAGMSERTLRRHFLAELHLAPETYIQRARMLKAVQLLSATPSRSGIEIALEVGYSSHSAFTAAFRRFFGRAPSAFRRKK